MRRPERAGEPTAAARRSLAACGADRGVGRASLPRGLAALCRYRRLSGTAGRAAGQFGQFVNLGGLGLERLGQAFLTASPAGPAGHEGGGSAAPGRHVAQRSGPVALQRK